MTNNKRTAANAAVLQSKGEVTDKNIEETKEKDRPKVDPSYKVLVDTVKEYDVKYAALNNIFKNALEIIDLQDRRSRARGIDVTNLRLEYTEKRKIFDDNLKKFESEKDNAK